MLILPRRVGERLLIGEDVTITILGIKDNEIRMRIDAPSEIKVYQEEVHQLIVKDQKAGV